MSPARLSLLALPTLLASLLAGAGQDDGPPSGGVATLYAQDDLLSSFDFRSGGAGGRLEEGEVRLESAQILFDVLAEGQLSYGFADDERVEIVDLGDVTVPPEARTRDRAIEFPISLVHTLALRDEGFAYVRPGGDLDPYSPADVIRGAMPRAGIRHLEPRLGHVYVLRIRTDKSSVEEHFKFQVIGLIPGHSLTLRWARVPRC